MVQVLLILNWNIRNIERETEEIENIETIDIKEMTITREHFMKVKRATNSMIR